MAIPNLPQSGALQMLDLRVHDLPRPNCPGYVPCAQDLSLNRCDAFTTMPQRESLRFQEP